MDVNRGERGRPGIILSRGMAGAILVIGCTGSMKGEDPGARAHEEAGAPPRGDVRPDAGAGGEQAEGVDAAAPVRDAETGGRTGSDASDLPPADAGTGPVVEPSAWAVQVSQPACDADDPEVAIIDDGEDWAMLEDSGRRVFCVEPGSYDRVVTLRGSGSADSPKYLRVLAPGDSLGETHPAGAPENQRVVVRGIELEDADHWVIDGLTVRGDGAFIRMMRGSDSDHNVFHRLLIEGGGSGLGQLAIQRSNDHNTLQYSVLRETDKEPDRDNHCIKIVGNNVGNRIVGNEIYDCAGDGIQLGSGNEMPNDRVEGAVIADNDFYLTRDMWTDCSGRLTRTGDCACAENAIDIKGVTDASDPVPSDRWLRIVGNRMWGFKEPDEACGSSGGITTSVVFHWEHTDNILFRDNVIFRASGGVATPDRAKGEDEESEHISIVNNLFYDIHDPRNSLDGYAVNAKDALRIEYYYNTFVSTGTYLRKRERGGRSEFRCNVLIDAGSHDGRWPDSSTADYNAYYGTERYADPGDHDLMRDTTGEAHQQPHCFLVRRLTGPEEVCVPDALPTEQSPHVALCQGPIAGTTDGIGVDDEPFAQASAGFAASP